MRAKHNREFYDLFESRPVEFLQPILLRQHGGRSNPDVAIRDPRTEWGRPDNVMNLVMISMDACRLQDLDHIVRVCSKI